MIILLRYLGQTSLYFQIKQMKKRLLLISLLLIGSFALADETFPDFPMTIYWDIKIWITNLGWWTLKVYNSSNNELTSFNITTAWKYGSNKATENHLLLNKFSWNLTFKVSYNWKIYVVDSIDDSNKWEWCPSKSSITFVSASCRYDITLKEDASSNSAPSNTWWWGWGGWWWGWGGWWWGWDTTKDKDKTTVNTWINTTDTTKTEESKTDTNENKDNNVNTDTNNWTNVNVDTSWYQEWNQTEILSNWYSREFNNAYVFAYRNWITTMDNISKGNMNWPLTRIAMAKMLANYAVNVLGKKPDIAKIPHFWDVDKKLDGDYNNWVTLAYQLWIMWVGIDKFRPYDLVNRWEFGTALSRMLYGLADWKWAYYEPHLAKLKELGVISNDNPNLGELRWYVMLMLMRSALK